MRGKQCFCVNNDRIYGEDAFKPPPPHTHTSGNGYCPFYGGDYVVVNSLFVAASIVWQLVLHLSFDMWLYYVIFCQVIIFFI